VLSNESDHGDRASGESGLATCTGTCPPEKVRAGTVVMLLTPGKEHGRAAAGAGLGSRGTSGSLCEGDALRLSRRCRCQKRSPASQPYFCPKKLPVCTWDSAMMQKLLCTEVCSERPRAGDHASVSCRRENSHIFDFINKTFLLEGAAKHWKCAV